MEEHFEAEGVVWTGNARLYGAVVAAAAGSGAVLGAMYAQLSAPLLVPACVVVAMIAYRLRWKKGQVAAGKFGLLLDGKLVFRRLGIAEAYVTRGPRGLVVVLRADDGKELDVEVGEGAWDLLQALGVDIGQRPLRLHGQSPGSAEITVGDDGVLICAPLSGLLSWKVQFVSYREIQGVETSPGADQEGHDEVELALCSGRVVRVDLQDTRRAHAARLATSRMLSAFQRAAASAARRAPGGGGVYRRGSHTRETLWRVLEQPSADPSQRARAVLALGRNPRDGDRARLRAATRSAVAPAVRRAVEAVSAAQRESKSSTSWG